MFSTYDDTQVFTCSGASGLVLVFSEETNVESGWYYLYVYDGSDNLIVQYTETEAAGVTLEVPGDTVKIRLTSDGVSNYYGYSFTSISTTGTLIHTGTETTPGVEPSCTEPGRAEGYICEICGVDVYDIIPAHGHDFNASAGTTPGKEATCTEPGRTEGICCTYCGEESYSQIPAMGHDYEAVLTPSTPDAVGYFTYTCTRCGDVYVEQYDYIGEGLCGETLSWTLEEGILFLSGNGRMADYASPTVEIANTAPWYSYRTRFSSLSWIGEATYVGAYAFYDADNLTSVTLPETVAHIGEGAFAECSGITAVTLPRGLVRIDAKAFANCTGLTTITISRAVSYIGEGAFEGIEDLTIYGSSGSEAERYANENGIAFVDLGIHASGTHGENISWQLGKDGVLVISGEGEIAECGYGEYPWYDYSGRTYGIVIEQGITSIPMSAFSGGYGNVDYVFIPDTVTSISASAFGIYSLISLNIQDLNAWADIEFGRYDATPGEYTKKNIFVQSEPLIDLELSDDLVDQEYVFRGFDGLRSVTVPALLLKSRTTLFLAATICTPCM